MKSKNFIRVAIVVGLILLIPLFGNLYIDGWNWGFADFVIMGGLMYVTGLALEFTAIKLSNPLSRLIALISIVAAFLLIWVELATDGVSRIITSFFY